VSIKAASLPHHVPLGLVENELVGLGFTKEHIGDGPVNRHNLQKQSITGKFGSPRSQISGKKQRPEGERPQIPAMRQTQRLSTLPA
jgi:hypothetical protein